MGLSGCRLDRWLAAEMAFVNPRKSEGTNTHLDRWHDTSPSSGEQHEQHHLDHRRDRGRPCDPIVPRPEVREAEPARALPASIAGLSIGPELMGGISAHHAMNGNMMRPCPRSFDQGHDDGRDVQNSHNPDQGWDDPQAKSGRRPVGESRRNAISENASGGHRPLHTVFKPRRTMDPQAAA